MNTASQPQWRSIPKVDIAVAEGIAHDTHTSVEAVQCLYEEELATLARSATITQFLGVLASRRVRLRLRKHLSAPH